MISFFRSGHTVYAVGSVNPLSVTDTEKLAWLFQKAQLLQSSDVPGVFIGPRKEMVTPWSTNAVEIAQNMGITGIYRIEEYNPLDQYAHPVDKMLQQTYHNLDQEIFLIDRRAEEIVDITDIEQYSETEGLALSDEEIKYLEGLATHLNRPLTDTEVFGFSQINSEHCRHKIFNGTFIIDGEEKPNTLFQLIKETSRVNPNQIVSAYKDNVAFIEGPEINQFAPRTHDKADYFEVKPLRSVISLKAETHNFPTTVEPFNGAATGSGGEIRDRLAGGKGSLPLAGTAVYMTSYPRLDKKRKWENKIPARKWLYQSPVQILIKASDGASDFGNKFGQPLICGSLLTFEHEENGKQYGFDKVIMLAGGVGYGIYKDSRKEHVKPGDRIILLGGENFRIGMGGGAVSSVGTGEYQHAIELNAIQRSNPEMQKRVMNAIRALVESADNAIISIHDHGAGGHLNCLSELLEESGGIIDLDKLPKGDPTLSDKELLCNESQERMGLALDEEHTALLQSIAERERAPMYIIGTATGDQQLRFIHQEGDANPFDLSVAQLFGSAPKTILRDNHVQTPLSDLAYDVRAFAEYLTDVLQLESVACKDWLTNKVDRSVTGRVATQQTCGPIQLPLNNVGVMALDYSGYSGVATALGHAPVAALIDAATGSKLAIAKALTNLVWAALAHGRKGISLSANWMWPCKNAGEDARLYDAVEAARDFAIALEINIPTGKDSLSMTQKYPDGHVVYAPGTVIISAVAEVSDIRKTISPALKPIPGSLLVYIDFSGKEKQLGGSAFAQTLGHLGTVTPDVDATYFANCFDTLQSLIQAGNILAGHDISAGGLIVSLLEMLFPVPDIGFGFHDEVAIADYVNYFFAENPGVVIQVEGAEVLSALAHKGVSYTVLGKVTAGTRMLYINNDINLDIDALRDTWFRTSYLLDAQQRPASFAKARFENYKKQVLHYAFPEGFAGSLSGYNLNHYRQNRSGVRAAIIREKGVNGDREMAYTLFLAGFDVKDIHMTDLISGKEDLSDVNLIVFVGGFSNSDVLGSARGWAGAFLYNAKAKKALDQFYSRTDTLSLGVCNGCQLMMAMGLVYPEMNAHPVMHHNLSGKFESIFVNLSIPDNDSVFFKGLSHARLGAWVAHGEGRFILSEDVSRYKIAAHYSYDAYPGTPGGSDHHVAALSSMDGRHLVIMPHIERSLFPWNWPYYPQDRLDDEITPWILAFISAREWIQSNQ